MARCENMVSQSIPTQYDYKIVKVGCGSTGWHGDPIYCVECRESFKRKKHLPYECVHGVDMRPEGAFCAACEDY